VRISNIRIVSLQRALERPQRTSRGERNRRRFTLVIVETDAGITGIGDAYGDQMLMRPILDRLKTIAIGLDPCDPTELWRRLYERAFIWEPGGSSVCAISAIEVACWDIRGKAERVPVSELMGGAKRSWIEAYASDLHWDTPQHMAEQAARYVDQGFKCVKTHIGADAKGDLDRLHAVRSAIGPSVSLMIDVNTGLGREESLERGRQYAAFAPFWLEEPMMPYDYEGHAWLRKNLPIPIAVGENLYATHGFAPMLDTGGCDYVMPDASRSGGLRQVQLICALARAKGVKSSPHNFCTGVGLAATLHLMAAIEDTEWLEYDPTGTAVYEELFVEPLEIQDGRVRVPTSHGLGVRLTDEIIQRYAA
jgi:D-galactarolactone cycloisomerase